MRTNWPLTLVLWFLLAAIPVACIAKIVGLT